MTDTFSHKALNKPPHHGHQIPSHRDISAKEGDSLRKHGLPVFGEGKTPASANRKPRHNRVSGEVRTETLI